MTTQTFTRVRFDRDEAGRVVEAHTPSGTFAGAAARAIYRKHHGSVR